MSEDEYREKVHAAILVALKKNVFVPIMIGTKTLKAVPSDVIKKMLEGDNLKIFYQAFTTESYDYENSYERLEIMGDLTVNLLVGNRIEELYPDLSPEEFTNMLSHYKSNKEFGLLITKAIPNLNDLILIPDRRTINTKIQADVFEALIRAVYRTANSVLPGIGFACAENVYKILTSNFRFDVRYALGNPKSLVLEIFKKIRVQEYPAKGADFRSGDSITVTIDRTGIDEVNKELNPKLNTITVEKLEVSRNGVDRVSATYDAYSAMLDLLQKSYNVTPTVYQRQKKINIIKSFARSADVEREELQRKEELSFVKKKSTIKGMVDWKLIAQNTITKKRRLVGTETVTKRSEEFDTAKKYLLEVYLSEKRR